MKTLLLIITFLLSIFSYAISQEKIENNVVLHRSGRYTAPSQECITPEVMEQTRLEMERNISRLKARGKLSLRKSSEPVQFIWPVRQAVGFNYPNYYSIVNYVDQDTMSGSIKDYNCGIHTYDGHRGLDISAFPFWWDMMENDQVEVIAAAPGTIVTKYNNIEDDQQCDGSQSFWNAFYIRHADSTTAIYGHLKYGSMNNKSVGEQVAEGEFLGIMGSSGRSSNPHLHFEVRDSLWKVLEPFAGGCNSLNANSMWKNQKPYWDSKLNQIFTHSPTPNIGFCLNEESMNRDDHFDPGEAVFVGAYFNKEQGGDITNIVALDAVGDTVYNFNHTANSDRRWSWSVWQLNMPNNGANGKFQIIATYRDQVVTHHYYVGVDDCTLDHEIPATNLFYGEFIQSSGDLTTNGLVNIHSLKQVTFQSDHSIILNPGFGVWAEKQFLAQIQECYPGE